MDEQHNFDNLFIALALFVSITLSGTLGFVFFDNYSFVEAFYMTVITMSTVGFGEVRPLSDSGMIFASILIFFSFGIFAYLLTTITGYVVEGGFLKYYKQYIVNKKLKNLNNHVIVCGYGRNGRQATEELLELNQFVVVIETKEGLLNPVHKEHPQVISIKGNATEDNTLNNAVISRAKALITTLPHDADNLFVVLTSRALNEKMTIISRASNENSDVKLKRAGANNVIMPDKVGGMRMAKLVAQPDIVEFLDAILLKDGDQVNLEEITCKDLASCFINKTIAELNIRRFSGANLIGLKDGNEKYTFNPSPTMKLNSTDKLFALGTPEQIKNLKKVLTGQKIINQNP